MNYFRKVKKKIIILNYFYCRSRKKTGNMMNKFIFRPHNKPSLPFCTKNVSSTSHTFMLDVNRNECRCRWRCNTVRKPGGARSMLTTIIDKYQHMHFFTFNGILVWNVNFNVKIHKILKGTPTCFDLNRSSSGSRSVPR